MDLFWKIGCRRSFPWAERKHVNLHKCCPATDIDRLLKLLFTLARKTNNDVGRKCGAIESLAHLLHLLQKTIDVIPSSHPPQNRIGTTLQRRMKLRAEVFAIRCSRDEVVVDLGCFDA